MFYLRIMENNNESSNEISLLFEIEEYEEAIKLIEVMAKRMDAPSFEFDFLTVIEEE